MQAIYFLQAFQQSYTSCADLDMLLCQILPSSDQAESDPCPRNGAPLHSLASLKALLYSVPDLKELLLLS